MVSILAKFRAGHRIAQEQPSKKAQASSNTPSAPYRHVPTHAITDALAGAPSYYRAQDLTRIREQHKRRSEMSRPSTSSGSRSTGSFTRSTGGRHSLDYSQPPIPPLPVDRIHYGGGKGKSRADRYEAGIRRSPLSSMEISPHISAANSSKSTKSSSSEHSSVESLSKISEERVTPRTESEDMAIKIQYTTIPNSVITTNFWSAPRQLSSSTPDGSQVIMTTTAEDGNDKPKKIWGLRRKSNARRG